MITELLLLEGVLRGNWGTGGNRLGNRLVASGCSEGDAMAEGVAGEKGVATRDSVAAKVITSGKQEIRTELTPL